ncbi:MAG: HAD-IIB family hydrolase, partial [Tumebacillaceae bacterium]
MAYKMLVCDIDGTLLNSKGELTPGVIAAIRQAHEQGIVVTLATGRHLRGVLPYFELLGVNVPVILSNGAVIVDLAKRETMLHHTIDRETTHAILDTIKKHGLWSSLFFHEFEGIDVYYDRDPGFPEAYYFVQKDPTVTKLVEDLKAVQHADPLKVLLLEKTEKVMPLVEDLRKLDCKFNMV